MTTPQSIPAVSLIESTRLQAALQILVEIQAKPTLNAHQMRMRAWDALDALAPEIAILPPLQAMEKVNQETK